MKLIKNGYDKTFEIQCNKCKSDLEYTLNDTKKHDDYREVFTGQMIEGVRYIVCPVCGKNIVVY